LIDLKVVIVTAQLIFSLCDQICQSLKFFDKRIPGLPLNFGQLAVTDYTVGSCFD